MDSYRMNFSSAVGTLHYDMEVDQFLQPGILADKALRVDVLHGSPPSQAFSRANTSGGRHDETNQDTGFSFGDILATFE